MNITIANKIDSESYTIVFGLLKAYNLGQTQQFTREINKPIEVIVRNELNEISGGLYGRSI